MSSDERVLPNCLSKVLLGGGIQKALIIKNCGKIMQRFKKCSQKKNSSGLLQQEILEKKSNDNNSNILFNLTASIISPNSTLDESGTIKLSEVKVRKV